MIFNLKTHCGCNKENKLSPAAKKKHASKLIYRLATKQTWTHTKTHTLKALEGWCMIQKAQMISGLKKEVGSFKRKCKGPESLIVRTGNKDDLFDYTQYVTQA